MQESLEKTSSPLHIKLHIFCKWGYYGKVRIVGLVVCTMLVSFCNPGTEGKIPPAKDLLRYNLEAPDARYSLPKYLEEISGLSYYGKGKIACVQDEKAHIYILNLEKEKIIAKYDFGSDADYEDISVVGSTAYILRNNGDIYRIKKFKKKDRKIKKFPTPLKEKNDTEGMVYDPGSNSLLIACKGSPSIEKESLYEGYKAIYRFDLEKGKLVKTPHILIDLERLDSYMDQSAFTKFSVRVAKKLRLIESETSFKPSGIAIHPIDGEIYIISSVGKLLIILNQSGKVLNVIELDPKLYRQPEGICFSPTGDMYISNEGKGGKGYILKFEIHAKI
jgi:uncharacterized protein YjiK